MRDLVHWLGHNRPLSVGRARYTDGTFTRAGGYNSWTPGASGLGGWAAACRRCGWTGTGSTQAEALTRALGHCATYDPDDEAAYGLPVTTSTEEAGE